MIDNLKQYEGFNATINTGEACNLACKYCYETNKKSNVQSFENAKAFIDHILQDDDPAKLKGSIFEYVSTRGGLILDFIGGDALMHPELLDRILKYYIVKSTLVGSKWKHKFRFSISTNGTLFSNPLVKKLLEKYKDILSISVSIDGCPEYHDLNRVFPDGSGSIKKIQENWDWFLNLYGENARQTKSTLGKNAIPYLFENIKYMHEQMNIKYINQNFIFEDMGLTQGDLQLLDDQFRLCCDYVLEHKNDLYWSMIDSRYRDARSYDEDIEDKPNSGWCGAGAMPALSTSGNFYPCFRFLPVSFKDEKNNEYIVGNVKDGFSKKESFEKVRSYTRETISPDKCKKCQIESCCSWCIAGAISTEGIPTRPTYICEITKLQYKWSQYYWNKFNEENKL